FQPFANGLEEQDSLTMVFSGIEFDMEALRANFSMQDARAAAEIYRQAQADRRELTAEERELLQGDSTMSLTATASFPEDLAGSLTVLVNYQNEAGDEQYLGGARYADGDIVPVNRNGQDLTSSDERGVGRARASIPEGGAFELEKDGERKTMLLETDLDAVGGRLETRIIYVAEDGLPRPDTLVMEL
ncbi:hypothetical protein QC820_16650, partial [Halomonas mongoliensis]